MSEQKARPPRTPAELQAALGKRLRWAVIGSLIVNAIGWSVALAIIKHRDAVHQQIVTLARIENKKRELLKPKKLPVKPKVTPKRIAEKKPAAPKQKAVKPAAPASAAPKIVTAKTDGPGTETSGNNFVVNSGTEKAGKPFDPNAKGTGGDGSGKTPAAAPPPVVPIKPPDPIPETKPVVKPTTVAKPAPTPAPLPIPARRGLTRKAEALQPLSAIQVSIPGDLQAGDFQPFARVLLKIDEQGVATPTLETSSGNAEIDRRVLDAVKKVRWQPALQDGQPVPSSFLYRLDFDVE